MLLAGSAPAEPRPDPSFTPLAAVETTPARRSYVVIVIDHTRLRGNNRRRAFEALRQAVSRLGEEDLIRLLPGFLQHRSDSAFRPPRRGGVVDPNDPATGRQARRFQHHRELELGRHSVTDSGILVHESRLHREGGRTGWRC